MREIDDGSAVPPSAGAEAVLLLVEVMELEQQLAQDDRGQHRDDDEEIPRHHRPATLAGPIAAYKGRVPVQDSLGCEPTLASDAGRGDDLSSRGWGNAVTVG